METHTRHALMLVRENPHYLAQLRAGTPVGSPVSGRVLAMSAGIPRQYAGQPVREDGPEYRGPENRTGGRTTTGRETLIVDRAHFEHVVALLRYVAANLAETEAASADLIEDSADLLEEARMG